MQKRIWIIGAGIAFGISLVAHIPARLVIPEQSGKLRLLGIGGSVWRGEVGQLLYSGKALPVRNLNWTVRPAALLRGKLEADVREQQAPANHGTIGWDPWSRQLEVPALHWQFSGGSLDPWFQSWIGLGGQFVLDLEALRLPADRSFPSQMDGRLDWHNAELRINSEVWPVGSPQMQFSGAGDAIQGIVTNSQPLLPGDSSFQCTLTACRVELSLQPTPDAPQALSTGLSLLGLKQTANRFSGELTFPLEYP